MRHVTRLLLIAAVGLSAPYAAAQCTGTAGTDFQQVTLREMNAVPQDNIDQLNAAGADLTNDQISALVQSPLAGERIEVQAVILTDPLKSGLATANDGIPGRIHVFIRDVAAETDGVEGMGSQIVDGRGDGAIQQFFVGDEVTVCADVTYFNSTLQLAPVSITSNDNPRSPGDPILDPVVVATGEIHDTFGTGDNVQSQVDWNVYSDFVNQYVRVENATLIQGIPGARPNMLFSTTGDDATVRSYDTSVCFRNDRDDSYFPANQEPACNEDDFVPPATGIVNVQGFLTLAGTFDAFSSSVPAGGAFAISPIEESDFEIAVAPPIVTLEDTGIATSADGAVVRATVIPGTAGNTIASVTVNFTTSSGASGSVDLVNTSGDTYEGTITGLTAGDFVSYTVVASDNQGAATPVGDPVSRRVLDGPVSSIFDIQATPNGGPGASGITTADPVPFDLDATVQSTFASGSNFFATIQDDPSLGAFTGVWVFFGSTDPGLTAGDQINISAARVSESFGLTQLSDITYTTTGSGDILGYKEVSTSLFNGTDGAATAEQHEGILLTFPNASIVATNADDPSGPFGEFLFSSGGGTLRADDFSADLSYEGDDPATVFTEGDVFEFIRGPLYFSFSNYKLVPNSLEDIGTANPVAVGDGPGESRVEIQSAFPNPTAGTVSVRFALATSGSAILRAFDATGREVATLAQGEFSASTHEVTGSLEGLATGVYVLRLEAGGEVVTSRIAVVR